MPTSPIYSGASALAPGRRRGFALLITIVLVAFLVLILVGLATFTRVETTVAANNQNTSLARQNAMTALNVALGEMQRFAGPDQRATARADILATSTQNGSSRWTGVWGDATEPEDRYTNNASPVLLNWLVSGNEGTPAAVADIDPVDGTGAITSAAAAPAGAPDQAVTNLTTASTALSTNLSVGGQMAALLVGPGTAGTADTSGYVVAPLMTIQADAAQVPGAGSAGTVDIGRYAWWVGDEGVKARYHVEDPRILAAAGSSDWATRLGATPRAALERMTNFTGYDLATDPVRRTVLDYGQVRFAQPTLAQADAQGRYHDVSLYSRGVPSDSARGGLKEDLSYHRATPAGFTGDLYPRARLGLDPGFTDPLPQKEKVLSYLDLDGVVGAGGAVAVRVGDERTQGLGPVVAASSHLFTVGRDATSGNLLFLYTPVYVLANPWNVTLTGDIELFIEKLGGSNLTFWLSSQNSATWTTPITPYTTGNLYTNLGVKLRIPNLNLAPGEARIFSLDETTASGSTIPWGANATLVNRFNPTVALALDTGQVMSAADLAANRLVRVSGTNSPGSAIQTGALSVVMRRTGDATDLQRVDGLFRRAIPSWTLTPSPGATLPGARGYRFFLKSAATAAASGDVRFLADYNWAHQPTLRRVGGDTNNTPFESVPAFAGAVKADAGATPYDGYVTSTPADDGTAYWGSAYDNTGVTRMTLFHAPRAGFPAMGVGQLRHADLTTGVAEPAHAVGGGLASPFVGVDAVHHAVSGSERLDSSYLLNIALLDSYLISNVPQTGAAFDPASDTLPFARLRPRKPDGTIPTLDELRTGSARAFAANAVVEGAFNVNSTSVEAWKAQLAALKGLGYGAETGLTSPFPRSPFQIGGSAGADDPSDDDAWGGLRNLTDAEVDALATQIVAVNRARGPALTLAHFANRRIGAIAADDGRRGRLQAAIDASGINAAHGSAVAVDTTAETTLYAPGAGPLGEGAIGAGAPGWLGQNDVLALLAPALAARSDTFTVRTYGEALNPATGDVEGRAWCEAVVQRCTDYVDGSDAPDELIPTLSAINQTQGRRFRVIAFRWLNPDDI